MKSFLHCQALASGLFTSSARSFFTTKDTEENQIDIIDINEIDDFGVSACPQAETSKGSAALKAFGLR